MSNRLSVFIAACTGMLLFGMSLITLGAVIPDVRVRFQLTAMDAGTLFSLLPLGILAGSLVFGPLSDRYGYKYVLVVSSILLAIGFEGIAFSRSHQVMRLFILLFGISGGAINGATNAAVADSSSSDKRSGLSLLGVFFAIGALGMPFLLGLLRERMDYTEVLASAGALSVIAALYMTLVRFPAPKQQSGFPIARSLHLLKDSTLLSMAFFLFCQSSFEGIINNWMSTFLISKKSLAEANALYVLSLFMAGMAATRLLIGSVGSKLSVRQLLSLTFVLLLVGILVLWKAHTYGWIVSGALLIGAGLAPAFPLMLGLVGSRYPDISATAFSLVLTIALTGNMLINFSMGVIAQHFGIGHLVTMMGLVWGIMLLLGISILRHTSIKTD